MSDRIPDTPGDETPASPPREASSALATTAPRAVPARRPEPFLVARTARSSTLVDVALDELDRLGDRIAGALGVR